MPFPAPLRRTIQCCSLGLLAVVFALATPQARGEDSEQLDHFENHIRPLLLERCSECHGESLQENGLRLDSRQGILRGGQRGAAVVPGKVEQSLLYQVISGEVEDLEMPPEGKPLTAEEQEHVARWIRQGAHWSETQPPASGTPLNRIAEIHRTHWAYRPITAPALPEHASSEWPRNTIDHFVLARLEAAGLEPAAEAGRRTLIRRAYFDLIGLPPSYEEVEAFVADDRENAYELLIERLLVRPEYGQRWGRHWLDVARYSDTRGHTNVPGTEIRFPFAWTYRDYVIRALNEDRPYDRFLNEQLAADLITETAEENLAALGFLTVGRRFLNRHHRIVGERIDLVSRGLMGITIMCAKCHDHKFDPFTIRDFYALYGIFASSAEPLAIDLPEIGPAHSSDRHRAELLEAELKPLLEELHELRDALIEKDLQEQAEAYLALAVAAALGKDLAEVDLDEKEGTSDRGIKAWRELLEEQEVLARFWQPLLGLAEEDLAEEAFVEKVVGLIAKDQKSNRLIREALLREKPASLIAAVRVIGQTISSVYDRWQKLQELDPGDDGFADPAAEEIRRLLAAALEVGMPASAAEQARWFLGREVEPLTKKSAELEMVLVKYRELVPVRAMALIDAQLPRDAAVQIRGNPKKPGPIVRRQFYELLAADCEAEPVTEGSGRAQLARWITHPKNPLTARVIANRIWGWHFGQHLVATPSDFGTRAVPPTHPALLDHLAVTLRDAGWSLKALHRLIMQSATYRQQSRARPEAVAKDPENHFYWRMNRRRLEFEPMRDAMLAVTGELDRGLGGPPLDDLDSPRRSVYLLHDRRSMAPVLPTFDVPVADATLPKRSETTVPQQALYLMNSGFVTRRASRLAARLADVFSDAEPAERLAQLYRWVYGREPSADEQADMEKFLAQTARAFLSRPEAERQLAEHDACWSLGSGRFDAQREVVADFKPLPHFDGRRWWQTQTHSWQDVYLDALGGRPGAERAAIRRWQAPTKVGTRYVLRGTFRSGRYFGDGVDVQVVSSREGLLKEFAIDEAEPVEIHLENLQIEAGDTLDLVVSPREENAFDDFSWSPRIVEVGENESGQPYALRQWRFEHAFRRSVPVWEGGLDPWEQLAQVLLISNEFMFVD